MPFASSTLLFVEDTLFFTVNYFRGHHLCSGPPRAIRSHRVPWPDPQFRSPESCGFTLLLQPQRLNNLLLSREDQDIMKREEDAPSVPVGHMRGTLNERAAGPQPRGSAAPYLLHCFVGHALFAAGLAPAITLGPEWFCSGGSLACCSLNAVSMPVSVLPPSPFRPTRDGIRPPLRLRLAQLSPTPSRLVRTTLPCGPGWCHPSQLMPPSHPEDAAPWCCCCCCCRHCSPVAAGATSPRPPAPDAAAPASPASPVTAGSWPHRSGHL